MRIVIVVAMDERNVIGARGALPWRGMFPADLKRFRMLTMGYPIIMGRKTYESIGHPLPGRMNIVVSRTLDRLVGAHVARSLSDALEFGRTHLPTLDAPVFVIGGAEIYRLALITADAIELTRIHARFAGDTFFPEIDWSLWRESRVEYHCADAANCYPWSYIRYERIRAPE